LQLRDGVDGTTRRCEASGAGVPSDRILPQTADYVSNVSNADLQHAVVTAASARAKPIILTGLAAMLGALFILDDPIFNGLAISLIFGILVSTLLTLVVIPVLYYAALYKKIQ